MTDEELKALADGATTKEGVEAAMKIAAELSDDDQRRFAFAVCDGDNVKGFVSQRSFAQLLMKHLAWFNSPQNPRAKQRSTWGFRNQQEKDNGE